MSAISPSWLLYQREGGFGSVTDSPYSWPSTIVTPSSTAFSSEGAVMMLAPQYCPASGWYGTVLYADLAVDLIIQRLWRRYGP
jgi:hypothetical protein